MDTTYYKQPDLPPYPDVDRSRYWGCLKFVLLFPVFLCLICMLWRLSPHIWALMLWHFRGPSDYQITVSRGGYLTLGANLMPNTDYEMTIHEGQVVKVCSAYPVFRGLNLNDFQPYTVDGFFGMAGNVVFSPFLVVGYDASYGYPTDIHGGFIEGGGIGITDFQIITVAGAKSSVPPNLTCIQ